MSDKNSKADKFVCEQRTLVFAARGITATHRHLMNDLKKLLPHSKDEHKFDHKADIRDINDLCMIKDCSNCLFFRKESNDLCMFISKINSGPTLKFKVSNITTLAEMKLTGNCLLGSRPVLHFDGNFSKQPHLKLIKEVLTQVFATPNLHPKSKPFSDHVFGFYVLDDKIWFRNYQMVDKLTSNKKKTEKQLVEIGPRFVLEPIRILDGSFEGDVLYNNDSYVSTKNKLRLKRKQISEEKEKKLQSKNKRKKLMEEREIDPVESVFLAKDSEDSLDSEEQDSFDENDQEGEESYDEEGVDEEACEQESYDEEESDDEEDE